MAGGLLGGSITFMVSRQQMKFAQVERREAATEDHYRRTVDRRFQAYTEFITRARTYRDSIRPVNQRSDPTLTVSKIDEYARSADTASAFVYLVTESQATYDACSSIMRTLGEIQAALHGNSDQSMVDQWSAFNAKMADALRQFQVAARAELDVGGVSQSAILTRRTDTSADRLSSAIAIARYTIRECGSFPPNRTALPAASITSSTAPRAPRTPVPPARSSRSNGR